MTKEERENNCFGKLIKKDIPPMSTEQAIEILHELDGTIYDTQQVALDMAIKALEQQPSEDCVSRKQAKIDVIPNSLYTSEQVMALLDNLSPVTPTFPKGATNGDVMLAIFKEIQHYSDGKICADWWNAPYIEK